MVQELSGKERHQKEKKASMKDRRHEKTKQASSSIAQSNSNEPRQPRLSRRQLHKQKEARKKAKRFEEKIGHSSANIASSNNNEPVTASPGIASRQQKPEMQDTLALRPKSAVGRQQEFASQITHDPDRAWAKGTQEQVFR